MSERREIMETVLDTAAIASWKRLGEDAYPRGLIEFIAWLQGILESIPAEHRAKALIELNSEYESGLVDIEVTYYRPETEEEWLTRVRQEQERRTQEAAEIERRERLTLKLLLEKYGAP